MIVRAMLTAPSEKIDAIFINANNWQVCVFTSSGKEDHNSDEDMPKLNQNF